MFRRRGSGVSDAKEKEKEARKSGGIAEPPSPLTPKRSGGSVEMRRSEETSTPTSKRMWNLSNSSVKALKPTKPAPPIPSSLPPVDKESLALVQAQAMCSVEDGERALRACSGDVVDALMYLSRASPAVPTEDVTDETTVVQMLMASGQCPESVARAALESNGGDLVSALLSLSTTVLTALESDNEDEEAAAVAEDRELEDEEDVLAFAVQIQKQLKILNRQSVNVGAGLSRRDMLEQELISTEQAYCTGLTHLHGAYVKPMMEASVDGEIRKALGELSEPLSRVVELHRDLFLRFTSGRTVADALMIIDTFEASYGLLIETIQRLLPRLDEWEKSKEFKQMMQRLKGDDLLDFRSFLITPVQRIPRYQLFLKDIIKSAQVGTPDFAALKECLQRVELVNRAINTRLANFANRNRMKTLTLQFVVDPGLAGDERRMLEKEGLLQWRDGKKWQKRKLFLFNDLIAIAKPKGKLFQLVEQHPLAVIRCFQAEDDGFGLRDKVTNREHLFQAASMQEQLEWISAISNGLARVLSQK